MLDRAPKMIFPMDHAPRYQRLGYMSTNTLFVEPYQSFGRLRGMGLAENVRAAREALEISQAELAKRVGVRQNTIAAIELGQTTKTRYLADIARVLGKTIDELDPPLGGSAPLLPPPQFQGGARDFPVYSSAEGGPGEVIRSTDPVDWVPRPAPVGHTPEAYCMLISGESMAPEYRPGDSAIVNPKLPIISGEVYIFYRELQGEARATIKHLRRQTGDAWLVSQHNPPTGQKADFILSRREWQWAHRVVGKYSRT